MMFRDLLEIIVLNEFQHPRTDKIAGDVDHGNCHDDQDQWTEAIDQKLEHESFLA